MTTTGSSERRAAPRDDATRAELNARGLRQLVRDARQPTLLIDPDDGRIVAASGAAAELLERPLAELTGSNTESIIAPDSQEAHVARRRAFAARPVIGPIGVVQGASAVTADGRVVPVEVSYTGIETEDGPLICAVVRDVTADLLRDRQDAALRHVAAAATSGAELDALLAMLVGEAAGLLTARRGLIARFGPEGIVVVGCHGDPVRSHVGDVIPADSGAALAELARTGVTARLSYADLDPGDPLREAALREGLGHAVAVPIDVPTGRWGGLMVATAERASAAALDALQRFAELAGVIIAAAESRAVEQALRESEERFRLVADFIPQLLWSADTDGMCDFLNPRWAEYTGIPVEDQLGHAWLAQVHPDDVPAMMAAWSVAVERRAPFAAEFRIRRHDGAWRRFDGRGTPMARADGTVARWFGSNTDVEDARAAEQAVRASEAQLRAALGAGSMGAWTFDPAIARLTVDAGVREMFDLGADVPDDAVRTAMAARVHPDDAERVRDGFVSVLAGADTAHHSEYRVLLPDGEVRYVETWGQVTRDSGGAPVLFTGVMSDTTERRRAGERALQSLKLEALGTLAGGIAHDFNNLLQVVGGNVALARAGLDAGHESDDHLETAERATRRAAELVTRILAFSRPDEAAEREPVALDALVGDALELLRPTLPAMLELRADAAPGLPPVLGDRVAIMQIVTNLATNAAQAIGRQTGLVEFRLERADLTAEDAAATPDLAPGPHVVLTVADDGPGMDPVTLARVFDPFFTTKGPGTGTGLGLSIVHSLMRAHGGAVTAYSDPGAGTSFRLWFPAAPGAVPEEAPRAVAPAVPPARRGGRVLVVDDEVNLVALHETSLGRAGHSVTGHTDPRAALEALRADPQAFDAVVTDLSMPGMTGLELAREVLALRPDMPVLIASGYIPPDERAEAEELGVRAILPKPAPISQMREAITAALGD